MDNLLLFRIVAIAVGVGAAIFGLANELLLKKAVEENKQSIRRKKYLGYCVATICILIAVLLKYFWIKPR